MNCPRWVFFDVDQTLCDFLSMMRRALTATVAEMERRWPELTGRWDAASLEELRNRIAATHPPPVPNVAVRRAMIAAVLVDVAADDQAVDEITDYFLSIRFADPIVFSDVTPTLTALSGTAQLGVITNGNSKLDALGLRDFFEAEFVAEEIGYAKPDPRIFAHAAERIGADPDELIMVGDSYEHDYLAPRAAGWESAWLRRGEVAEGPDQLTALTDLPAMINRS